MTRREVWPLSSQALLRNMQAIQPKIKLPLKHSCRPAVSLLLCLIAAIIQSNVSTLCFFHSSETSSFHNSDVCTKSHETRDNPVCSSGDTHKQHPEPKRHDHSGQTHDHSGCSICYVIHCLYAVHISAFYNFLQYASPLFEFSADDQTSTSVFIAFLYHSRAPPAVFASHT